MVILVDRQEGVGGVRVDTYPDVRKRVADYASPALVVAAKVRM